MAGNDLAVVASQLPAYLQGAAPSAADEFTGGLTVSFPLMFLSVRGKEFRLRKDGQELNTRHREISAVFVAARNGVSKRFYAKKYQSGTTEAPDCSSRDGIRPDVANPVAPDCRNCPNNQFGSRITESGKEGKACSDYKRLIVWLIGIAADPVVLDVSATSLKAPKGQTTTELMLRDYLTQLAKHGMDATQVVTKIAFTDAEYPQLCFAFERLVTEDEFKTVLDLRGSDDVKTVLDDDVYEPPGEIKEAPKQGATQTIPIKEEPTPAPAEPEPAAQSTSSIPAFSGKTTVMKNEAGELTIAEDETQYAVAWSQGYRPAQTAAVSPAKEDPAPKQEKPAPEAEPASGALTEPAAEIAAEEPAQASSGASEGDDDLLSAVAALLGGKS